MRHFVRHESRSLQQLTTPPFRCVMRPGDDADAAPPTSTSPPGQTRCLRTLLVYGERHTLSNTHSETHTLSIPPTSCRLTRARGHVRTRTNAEEVK